MWGRGPLPGPSGVERRGPALTREGAPGGGGGAGLLHPLAAPRRPCWALGPSCDGGACDQGMLTEHPPACSQGPV